MSLKRYRLRAKKIRIEPKYIAQFLYIPPKEINHTYIHENLGFKIDERLV